MTTLPDFQSIAERDEWITEHADYFTVVRKTNLRYERHEYKTLREAEVAASALAEVTSSRWLIYAVAGIYQAYVKTAAPFEVKHGQ